MEDVYFLKNREKLFSVCQNLFKKIYIANKPLLIKMSFGSRDNKFALKTNDIKPIIKAAESLGLKPILIDTPVAPVAYHRISKKKTSRYRKIISRSFSKLFLSNLVPLKPISFLSKRRYEKTIKMKGFPKLAPSIISDRFGKKIKSKNVDVEICRDFIEAENVLVISHVKGHICCGFGGAIKNLSMGMVSLRTKITQHFLSKPKIIGKCQNCGKCVDLCPAKAIDISKGRLEIDLKKCMGCSICQIECPYGCLAPEKAFFDDLLAQTAITVFRNLPQRTFFVNFAINIAKECDCLPTSSGLISEDAGLFFAGNPVLIDKASVDSIIELNGRNVFKEANHKDPYLQINSALKYGEIDNNYKLINL